MVSYGWLPSFVSCVRQRPFHGCHFVCTTSISQFILWLKLWWSVTCSSGKWMSASNSSHLTLIFISSIFFFGVLCRLLVGAAAVGIDTYVHGSFILTPVEFLKVNLIENIGTFYGSHPWYWYFTIGLPTTMGITFVPFMFAVAQTLRLPKVYPERFILLVSVLFTLVVYSMLAHKEFRFILPLLPMCLFVTADALSKWSRSANK